ncbi:hypothetical protein [Arenibaculum pallidiluteum]|uniref:hypothetical protein n=1 Tax=Arenibaculum pallidiluteum TaxID=2812559 RepID=UPI001A9666B2|nr:hypothetical protein [Arenibaculum pallidiluteum]
MRILPQSLRRLHRHSGPRRLPRFRAAAVATAAVVSSLALAACQTPTPAPPIAPLSFAQYGPIAFDVGQVTVENRYVAPLGGENVEHLAPTPPEQAVRRWVADRIQSVGRDGTLRVVIHDARIVAVPLRVTQGIQGSFRNEQSTRFDGRMEVELVGETGGRRFQGSTIATVERSLTIPENASPYVRDRALNDVVSEMMRDLNYRLETGALGNLAPLIRR